MGVVVPVEVPEEDGVIEVKPANADTIAVWMASATQWRMAIGVAGLIWLGLDYPAVDVVIRRMQPSDPDRVFMDLMVMEDVALATFGEGRG